MPLGPEDWPTNFHAKTEAEMLAHIVEHDKAWHHVRKSLLADARGESKGRKALTPEMQMIADVLGMPKEGA